MTAVDDPVMRPLLCRWGFHGWGPNAPWPRSTPGQVRWQRHCTRCGALLTFTGEPFLYGPVDHWKARRAVVKAAESEDAA